MFLDTALRQANWMTGKRAVAYPIIFLFVYAFIVAVWISGSPLIPEHKGIEISRDFANVYAAGLAAHEGAPAEVYDWRKQRVREHQLEESGKGPNPEEGYYPWFYPPMFLGVAWLLTLMPYYYALAVYLIAGTVAYGATVYKLAQCKQAKWAIAAFPGFYINLLSGQNGSITTALLAAGLFLLDQSPVTAGIFFGILSYKPQFFVLVPLALAVGRYWKALAATVASAGVCAVLSLVAFGLAPWLGFIRGLDTARATILEDNTGYWLGIMHTVFSMVRMLGGELHTAYLLQTVVAIAAALALIEIWSRRSSSLAVRGASLIGASLLSSPYSFRYDQVLLAIPIALLARQGIKRGFLPFEKIFLFALWLLPSLAKDYGEHYVVPLTPPLLIGLMVLCWIRTLRETRTCHEPASLPLLP